LRILGIESSCDETAAAIVEQGTRIVASTVASQLDVHAQYGGVVPELASREHLRSITPVVRGTMRKAGLGFAELDAVAVTEGPGLIGSLLVGITYAKAICLAHRKPLIAVNHLDGHVHAAVMEQRTELELPAVALIVSGGHTHLFEAAAGQRVEAASGQQVEAASQQQAGWHYRLLGRTRDDAAGEAFDKVAKLLGFGYPGGPVIDQLTPHGNPRAIRFTPPNMKGNPLDFSFSGIKTAVRYWVAGRDMPAEIAARGELLRNHPRPTTDQWLAVTPPATLDLLASFQHAVVEDLLTRSGQAAEAIGARSILISGGVASNTGLRRAAEQRFPFPVFFPRPALATDNAVMIAAAAYPKLLGGAISGLDLKAKANLPL
jgi:N6-L-threonylcarbamoyladenine synthase